MIASLKSGDHIGGKDTSVSIHLEWCHSTAPYRLHYPRTRCFALIHRPTSVALKSSLTKTLGRGVQTVLLVCMGGD